jgi:DNA-binding SARP family transcriptional activator/tetratricopeptide (TPR) repeat protein
MEDSLACVNNPAPAETRLMLLGTPAALIDGRAIALPPRVTLLLTLVALGGPLERKRAAAWMYPGAEPSAARRNLRQTLHQQQAVFSRLLLIDTDFLRLHPEIWVDTASSTAPSPDDADDSLPAVATLLGELRFDEWPDFQIWLDSERARQRRLQIERLAAFASACEQAGQLARALQASERLLVEEPTSEHAHRRMMRLHYLRGDRSAALAAFDRCERVLKDELSARPAAETLELLRMIEAAEVVAAAGTILLRPLPVTLLRPPRSVGRDTERQLLAGAWAGELVFFVQGEAGIGKSRLLEDHLAQYPGALLVRARHGDARRPYATLARLLQELPGRSALPAGQRELITLLCSGTLEAGLHDARASAQTIREAAMAALTQAQLHPVIDDLHLADAATIELLALLASDMAPGHPHWGFAARPHDVPALLELRRTLQDRGRLCLCQLQPLAAPQIEALLASLQLPQQRVALLTPTLVRRGAGNPMFTLELLKGWFSHASVGDPERVPVPQTIALLLDQQISACSPRAASLARLAALAASDFTIELAEAVLGETALALADAWRELEDRQLMRNGLFAHDLIFEAALRSVPTAIALSTHGRIAAWLAAHGGAPSGIAMHWLAAGREALAIEPLCQAARQAIGAGRIGEAGQRYQQAAEMLLRQGDTDAAFDRYFDACELYVNAGATLAYEAAAEQAMPLARSPQQIVRAKLMQAFGMYMRGDLAGCERLFPPLLDEAIAVGERRTEAECRVEISRLLRHEGRLRECLRMLAPAAEIFRELGLPARELVARNSAAMVVALAGLDTPSRPMLLADLDGPRLDQLAGPNRRAKPLINWLAPARIAADVGDFERALTLIDEVFDELAAPDQVPSVVFSGIAIALSMLVDLGQYGRALELLRRIDARDDAYRLEWRQLVEAERAVLWQALGRPEQALQAVRQLDAAAGQRDQLRVHMRVALLKLSAEPGGATRRHRRDEENLLLRIRSALALLPAESPKDALDELRQIDATALTTGFDAWRPALQALQALRLAELGDAASAECADNAEQGLALHAMPASVAQACIWLALARQRGGDPAGAARIACWGRDWLGGEALTRVPPLFHDSFLQRNPVHSELLALAQSAVAHR